MASRDSAIGLHGSLEPRVVAWETMKGPQHPNADDSIFDAAWDYLDSHRGALGTANMEELRRKIDWRIMPLMFLCYTMQFIDKVIYNYAAVMGIKQDLKLKGNDFSNIATFFFIAYLCFEVPNAYLLQKLPAAKWFAFNVIMWGISTACSASAQGYKSLLACRIFGGVFEATMAPSLLLISSQWYTRSEQPFRFAIWYAGVGTGQVIGGFVSYGFQHIRKGATLDGWRTMFLALGILTIAAGFIVLILLPDTPMKATWLTEDEKVTLLKHVSVNQTGIENHTFRPREILEALVDPQMYLIILAVILLSISGGVVTTYSATLIRNLGFNSKTAALMNVPSGMVSLFCTLTVGFGIHRWSNRWAWVIGCIIPGIIGGALMSFLSKTNKAGIIIGIYLVNSIVAVLPVYYNWTASNVSGYTKRAFAAAIVAGSFSTGSIIGPQTFQQKDAPDYRPAKIAVMGTQAGCGLVTFTLFLYYTWMNKRRIDEPPRTTSEAYLSADTWAVLTDKKNSHFIYVY